MHEGQEKAVFDWDEYWNDYYEDLAQEAVPAEAAFDYDPPPRDNIAAKQRRSTPQRDVRANDTSKGKLRETVLQWLTPVLVVAAFAVVITLPEKFGIAGPSLQSAQLFVALPTSPAPEVESVNLRAYSERQQRMFVTGLKRLSDADLLSYAASTQTDLDRADPVMASLLEDAMTLTRMEIDRRNLNWPRAVRTVEEVLIPLPE